MIPQPDSAGETVVEPRRNDAFWSWVDAAIFVSFMFLSFMVTGGILVALQNTHRVPLATELVVAQSVLYVLVIGALYLIIVTRYHEPFWRSMGYRRGSGFWPAWAAGGVVLAVLLAVLGAVIRAPNIPLPFENLLRGPLAIVSLGFLVVLLGPFCEELVFRGFFMPLFMRSLGVIPGILLAGVLFGAMHAPEYRYHWQQVALVSTAGAVFGWARYRTRSTFPAMAMHAGFNFIQFVLFLAFHNP